MDKLFLFFHCFSEFTPLLKCKCRKKCGNLFAQTSTVKVDESKSSGNAFHWRGVSHKSKETITSPNSKVTTITGLTQVPGIMNWRQDMGIKIKRDTVVRVNYDVPPKGILLSSLSLGAITKSSE